MDCREAQERVLDGVVDSPELRQHFARCAECAAFAAVQQRLDEQLRSAIPPAPRLGPHFRAALRARRTQPAGPWPDWLLEVAHFGGWAAAIGLCARLLPVSPQAVIGFGALAAIASYALEMLIASALEEAEENAL